MSNTRKRLCALRKRERRIGKNLTGLSNSPFNKRPYAPGRVNPLAQHYKLPRGSRASMYRQKLDICQSIRSFYDISKTSMKFKLSKAKKKIGNTSNILQFSLESTLLNAVMRGHFTRTIFGAKQLISHRKIMINGNIVTFPYYTLKAGDVVSVIDSMRDNAHIKYAISTPPIIASVPYITKENDFTVRFERAPVNSSEVTYPHSSMNNFSTLVEFYG